MTRSAHHVGPIKITESSRVRLRPVASAVIGGGLWAERRRVNRETSVPNGWDRLHDAGNFTNLALAAGQGSGEYVGDLPFLDSDIYKWLEAVAWTLGDPDLSTDARERLTERLTESAELLRRAQQTDGYLDSYFQVLFAGERFVQLAWGHELYCAGHLIQAAVALHRSTGDDGLLRIARPLADLIGRSFGTGEGLVDGVCGHPEIETALVELYRETGERAYLDRALYFVDRRGYGLLGDGRFGRHYWQDHQPVRAATSVQGHAVRQLYLLAGVADLFVETGDETLLASVERLCKEMVATKTYLTGGIGAHHTDEAFGAPYELPSERSYCETCAAIAVIMFCWRMLMITGQVEFADLLERTLYNGFLAGVSLDGQRYIYANPLQVREGLLSTGSDGDYVRVPWFRCACCPPNVMRLLASLDQYVALGAGDSIAVHQFVSGTYTAKLSEGPITLTVATEYPWQGTVVINVAAAPAAECDIAIRIPAWAVGVRVLVNGRPATTEPAAGWWSVTSEWRAGDQVVVELPLPVRLTAAHPRVDATRGCVALERGPLVYCVEAVDHPGVRLDDLVVDPSGTLRELWQPDLLGGIVTVTASGWARDVDNGSWPYRPYPMADTRSAPRTLIAVPYYAWGNRDRGGAMRVWIPTQ